MTNKDIAKAFRELGQLMELHKDNPFKIRSYNNAYITLRKLDTPVATMPAEELAGIKGIGKAIVGKIQELATKGTMDTLEAFREKTPVGVRDMLGISGFGPKKVRIVWQELGVESIGALLYAVNENRLIEIKGFGEKTQADLKKKLAYFQLSKGQYLYARVEDTAQQILDHLRSAFPEAKVDYTGAYRRAQPTLKQIEFLIAGATPEQVIDVLGLEGAAFDANYLRAQALNEVPLHIQFCEQSEWGSKQFRYTAGEDFMASFIAATPGQEFKGLATEEAVFAAAGFTYLPPELRETSWGLDLAKSGEVPTLIEASQVVGVIHSHTTYSDGIHTLADMAAYAREQGYQYIGITDHSKAAFYANGLKEDRLLQQIAEIDQLNAKYDDFRILKGIESDILADGSLDYSDDILAQLDFVIASVHSNLRMDEAKATERLLKAIANPHTSILGHPTGRLLLSRPGYPIDHQRIIDACATHNVAIELNANPLRLDLDWTWIPYAMEKGVLVSINPDAHSKEGIHDIAYGTLAARKGGLTADGCLNSRPVEAFLQAIAK